MLYDRIIAIVNGVELTARPIEFELDRDGMPIRAIKWETTSPVTGEMVQFGEKEVKWNDEIAIYGEPCASVVKNELKIKHEHEHEHKSEVPVEVPKEECPFIELEYDYIEEN
jgi:hypothetical protein